MTSRSPRATYRLQLGPHVRFEHARELVGYLDRLGISHLYLSPIWKAREGSTHFYDVVDPTQLDPRLGTREDFDALVDEVHAREMGIVCDVVPNHMAASHENPWWWDVLERGPASPYADLFDIDWDRGEGKVVLPVLAHADDEPAVDGEVLRYHDRVFPKDGYYRLVDWRRGEREINYRRFFDITDLVAMNMDEPRSIDLTHALVFTLAGSGAISGVRIDHVDGLRHPGRYLSHLRSRLPSSCFVLVEKILARGESLPRTWECEGTTGYEHADVIEAVFVDPSGASALRSFARAFTGVPQRFGTMARRAKREVVESHFSAEVDALARRVAAGGPLETAAGRLHTKRVRRAIVDATVALDVYRTYIDGEPDPDDRRRMAAATSAVRDPEAAELLRHVFGRDADAVARWQQLTAPAAAKGVEDTALYRHVPLVSRNEVGSDPARPAVGVDELHAFNAERLRRWPSTMNASSTHDSKRGEDVRARIDVLSEMGDEWTERVETWSMWNRGSKLDGAPDATDELLLYQTLVGAWPVHRTHRPRFEARIREYMRKAAREAKRRTDWRDPNEAYEGALDAFVASALSSERFVADIGAFAERVARHGAFNSLSRVVLKVASPGFPDVYQGAELWHLRLVDPDNRAPVDFGARRKMLEALDARSMNVDGWQDGTIKLFTTQRSLRLRRTLPDVFADGSYVPLPVTGRHRACVIAFARRLRDRWIVACVPRFTTRLSDDPMGAAWGNTRLELGSRAPSRWRDAFTDEVVTSDGGALRTADVLSTFPVALLVGS